MKRSKRLGITLIEALVASVISTAVLLMTLTAYITAAGDAARGTQAIDSESNSKVGVRRITNLLREAMEVTVDSDGKGVTFKLPARNTAGRFQQPLVWDNKSRRIYFSNGSMWYSDGTNAAYVIARNVTLYDPFKSASKGVDAQSIWTDIADTNPNPGKPKASGTDNYLPFVADVGMIVRSLTVTLVSKNKGKVDQTVVSRNREVVYLRNLPEANQ